MRTTRVRSALILAGSIWVLLGSGNIVSLEAENQQTHPNPRDGQGGNKQEITVPTPTTPPSVFINNVNQTEPQQGRGNTDKVAQWVLILVTLLYVGFAGLQWLAIRDQGRSIRDQLAETVRIATANETAARAAERSADAAKENADILIKSERPHVALDQIEITVNWDDAVNRTVRLIFRNYGRTPAFAKAYTVRARIDPGLDLVGPPAYGMEDELHNYILVPGQPRTIDLSGPLIATPGDNRTLAQMYQEGDHLFLFGFIAYDDIFGKRHVSGFNCRYGPPAQNIFVNAGDDTYWQYS